MRSSRKIETKSKDDIHLEEKRSSESHPIRYFVLAFRGRKGLGAVMGSNLQDQLFSND